MSSSQRPQSSARPAAAAARPANPATPGDDLTDGGEERLRSESWPNPNSEPGDTILGKIRGFRQVNGRDNKPVTIADFAPVVVATRAGKTAHSDLSLFLGSVLSQRITSHDQGRVFAVRFTGFEKGDKNTFRTFDTFLQTDEKLRQVLIEIGAEELLSGDGLPF